MSETTPSRIETLLAEVAAVDLKTARAVFEDLAREGRSGGGYEEVVTLSNFLIKLIYRINERDVAQRWSAMQMCPEPGESALALKQRSQCEYDRVKSEHEVLWDMLEKMICYEGGVTREQLGDWWFASGGTVVHKPSQ